MTTKELGRQEQALNEMLRNARFLEAFEKFYHDDVVMQENTQEPVVGKAANRKKEEEFFGGVEQVEEVRLLASAVDGDASFSEWNLRLVFKDGTAANLTQVAARRWKDGLIVHERFYYAN